MRPHYSSSTQSLIRPATTITTATTDIKQRRMQSVQRIVRRRRAVHLGHVIGVQSAHGHGLWFVFSGKDDVFDEYMRQQDGEELEETDAEGHESDGHQVVLKHLHQRIYAAVGVDVVCRVDLLWSR